MYTLPALTTIDYTFQGKTFRIRYMGFDSIGLPFYTYETGLGWVTNTLQSLPPPTARVYICDILATTYICTYYIDIYSTTATEMTFDFVCVPNWVCEQPLNGYESDGCGNRRLNSACNPVPVLSTITIYSPSTTVTIGNNMQFTIGCKDTNNNVMACPIPIVWNSSNSPVGTVDYTGLFTGLVIGTTIITATVSGIDSNPITINVTPPSCVPNWVCEQPLNGYESDGCGDRRLNSVCNPCVPNWVCEQPLNGYESDGCGNRRLNSNCSPVGQGSGSGFLFLGLLGVALLGIMLSKKK